MGAGSGPTAQLTNPHKTPLSMFAAKPDQNKLFTPVAFSPLNRDNGQMSKTKIKEEPPYYPGMLKVSPNSGFQQFKKPAGT